MQEPFVWVDDNISSNLVSVICECIQTAANQMGSDQNAALDIQVQVQQCHATQ